MSPTWTDITPPDAPDFVRINTIEASPTTPGKAYVSGIRYLVDDDRSPYIWKTEDYGQSWTKIVNGIPADDFVRATREDPTRAGLLYAASERTVYVSWNDGANWQPLSQNLPVVHAVEARSGAALQLGVVAINCSPAVALSSEVLARRRGGGHSTRSYTHTVATATIQQWQRHRQGTTLSWRGSSTPSAN